MAHPWHIGCSGSCATRATMAAPGPMPDYSRRRTRPMNTLATGFAALLIAAVPVVANAQTTTTDKVEKKTESTVEKAETKTKNAADKATTATKDSWITSKTKIA